jgi:hypothetical protein
VRIAETAKRKSRLEPAAALCDRVLILNRTGVCCAPERSRFALRGLSFWERHLPWALPRIQQAIAESKWRRGDCGRRAAGHGRAGVCLRDASSTFGRGMRSSGIAVRAAARRHGPGRSGRPGGSTGPRRGVSRSEAGKASDTGNASSSAHRPRKRLLRRPRGSSLRSFFDGSCSRPGCYECFRRSRRSPLQRFCSHACQRAMERVWERERRWRRRHGRRDRFPGRRPRARQP